MVPPLPRTAVECIILSEVVKRLDHQGGEPLRSVIEPPRPLEVPGLAACGQVIKIDLPKR